MNPFPVQHSILSKEHLVAFLNEKYPLGEKPRCKLIKSGINHTYLVSTLKSKYIFRVYSHNWRTELEIDEEIKLLQTLKDANLPVSFPIADTQNHFIQKFDAPEGTRYGVLFSFAEGDKIRQLNETNCYQIGSLMANFHKVTLNKSCNRTNYNHTTLTELPYQFALEHFPESLNEMKYIKAAGEHLSSIFREVDSDTIRHGVVHLDMWYDNMSITDDSQVTIFDFDFCGNGWLLLDIAYCIMQMFHTEPDKEKFKSKQQAFYNGYESVTTIRENEKKLVPVAGLAVWIFYLGVQSQRFDNWSNIFLSKNYLNHYIGMARSWLDYNEVEIEMWS